MQTLDELNAQLGETDFIALLVIQSFNADLFLSADQQKRLSELISLWRVARDRGEVLLLEQQAELDALVYAELRAANARTTALMQ